MKLAAALLGLCVALSCSSAAAFLVGSAKHVAQPVAALESAAEAGAGAGTLANPLGTLNPLKLLLSSLGIPVNHLIEGSQKCVAELGPEAVGAVKALKALLFSFLFVFGE
uniref:Secretoglobin family 3A member 1 n=1 Tax=Gorilla gorilla gorilla TaxID=9595 RepID=A0A2I2Z191_GORGO